MPAYIVGSGIFLPERVVTNEELAPQIGIEAAQIFKSSGIRSRRWVAPGTLTSSIAANAARAAMQDAGWQPEQLDYLILGTMTPDRFIPGTAPAIQTLLGAGEIPCLDIRAACCNLVFAIQLAAAIGKSGTASRIAVCLAEIQSRWLDISAASAAISMLFADGASAVLISSEKHSGALEIVDVLLATDGSHTDALGVRAPGSGFGFRGEAADFLPRMAGQSVILNASRKIPAVCLALLERNSLTASEVRWIVPHQANSNLLAQVARALGFNATRGLVNVLENTGNTSSASMGIALDTLRRSGQLQANDCILLPAFGAGFIWGAALCRVCH